MTVIGITGGVGSKSRVLEELLILLAPLSVRQMRLRRNCKKRAAQML